MVRKLSFDKKLPRESEGSFQKFLLYRNLPPHERSLKAVKNIIQNNNSETKVNINSLNQLAYRWSWAERCKLYDADQQLNLARKRADKFDELNEIMLDNTDELIRYANNLLGEVVRNPVKENGERYSLMNRIRMSNDVARLLKEANELVCNITGRPHEYKELNVNADVDTEITLDKFIDENLIKQVLEDDSKNNE